MTVFEYILMLAAGLAVGTVFFGGLWLTLERLSQSKFPALLMIASLFVRGCVIIFAAWLIADNGPVGLCLLVAGILISRTTMIRMFGIQSHRSIQKAGS